LGGTIYVGDVGGCQTDGLVARTRRLCLIHYFVNGPLRRRSFAKWLAPYVLRNRLRLNVITGFTSEDFHRLCAVEDEVATAWRDLDPLESGNWARRLAASAKCSLQKVYQRRERWLDQFNIDIEMPYALYRDLLFFGPNSLTSPKARSGIIEAVRGGNGDVVVRLLDQAANDFDRDRTTIVAAAVAAVPHEMRVRVACKAAGPALSGTPADRPVRPSASCGIPAPTADRRRVGGKQSRKAAHLSRSARWFSAVLQVRADHPLAPVRSSCRRMRIRRNRVRVGFKLMRACGSEAWLSNPTGRPCWPAGRKQPASVDLRWLVGALLRGLELDVRWAVPRRELIHWTFQSDSARFYLRKTAFDAFPRQA
jgi:hypothetical protein